MKKKPITIYKLVRRIIRVDGTEALYSFNVSLHPSSRWPDPRGIDLLYAPGKLIKPIVPGSPLFAFASLEGARGFLTCNYSNFELWEAVTDGPTRPCFISGPGHMGSLKEVEGLAKTWGKKWKRRVRAPFNAIFCPSLTLVKKIEPV
jgi:hypothetical protein